MVKNKKNRDARSTHDTTIDDREDRMELYGVVDDALPGTWFRIVTENNAQILATLSGKLRQNNIRVLPGDYVTVEVSPYNPALGRIVWRK